MILLYNYYSTSNVNLYFKSNLNNNCPQNYFKNTTTSLCQQCPYGQFYEKILNRCIDCESSCSDLCAYQTKCMQCNSTQVLDLTSYTCVNSCNTTTSVLISDSQFGISSFCRSFNYYVDPSSTSVVELGTKQFPYKSLALVFVELLNFHSNTARTINIYLKENTESYVDLGFNYIINMTSVNISPYSSTSSSPSKATIVGGEQNSPSQSNITAYFNNGTTFNILKSTQLRKSQQISSNFSSTEINYLEQSAQVFTIHRTNFSINNIILKTVFNNINSAYTFIFVIYLQDRSFRMKDIDFRVSGLIFTTYDPLNLYMENIDLDYSRNIGGFNVGVVCNYPEAYIEGVVNITNMKVYYSTPDRLIDTLFFHVFRYDGPGHYVVNGYYSAVYSTFAETKTSLYYQMQANCLPMLDTVHYINISNTVTTMPFENKLNDKITIFGGQMYIDPYRHHVITFTNVTVENVTDNVFPNFWVVGTTLVDAYIFSLKTNNASSQMSLLILRQLKSIVIRDALFKNSTASNQYMLMAYQSDNITISNVTMINVVGKNSDVNSFIYITNLNTGFISFDGLYIYNSSFDQHDGIFFDNFNSNTPSYLTLKNCIFSNINMKSQTSLINTAVMKNLYLSNITFNKIVQTDPTDTSNNMINIGGMDFNTTGSFSINQVYARNSSVSMLNMRNIINSNISSIQTLPISNIGYSSSVLQYSDNMINLKNIELDSSLQIQIFNISMTDITFTRGGNVILFQQQTKAPMTVTNLFFKNIYGGGVQFEAYNKNNLTLTTNMILTNMTVINCNGNTQSFLTATTGGAISIYSSSFTNNCNYLSGAVASADSLGTSISFFDSVFSNNTSIKGGVFYADNQGLVSCTNCTIQNNFAIQSGVIQASNDGYFNIYSSVISNNYAYTVPVSEVFLVSATSAIGNCTISNNIILSKDFIVCQFSKCDILCFMSESFKSYISQNVQLMSSQATQYSLQLIFSNLIVENNTSIINQNYFVTCFQSNFQLNNLTLQDSISYSSIISVSYSTFSINNLVIFNITKTNSESEVISVLFDSVVSINKLKYSNSSTGLLNFYSATIFLLDLEITSLALENHVIGISNCKNVTIQNTQISSLSSTSIAVIHSQITSFDLIQNVSLSDIDTTGIIIDNSNVTLISMLSLSNMNKGIIIDKNSIISSLSNSSFIRLGSSNILYGGALDVIDSILYINSSNFEQNQAMSGAAISVRCSSNQFCSNSYSNTNFKNNKAEVKGGVVYYSFKRPTISNCTFDGNIAPYGPITASYPIKIVETNSLNTSMIYENVPSGIKMDSSLVFVLKDFDNQTIPDSIYQIKVVAVSKGASTSGYNSAKASSGVATFNNLIFVSSPGSKHIQFKATSNAIDISKNTALGMSTQSTIDVSFRFCKPGEAQISSSVCQTCAPGTFSLQWNSTSCDSCLNNAVCSGGTNIEVNPEYWRLSTNSTTILDCPLPSACLGGNLPQDEFPVKCTTGYKSYLCSQCDIVDGVKYVKTSGNICSKCSIPLVNALKFCGLIAASFIFLTILIAILIRKKRENQTSILMRIFANYVQLISVSMTFKVKFPVSLTQLFGPINTFGSTSDTYLSYDCFISSIQVTAFTPSVDIFKIVLTGMMPIGLFLLYLAIWGTFYFTMNKWFYNLKRNLIISLICIIFMFHPTITKSCLQIFECTLVDENDKRMNLYMEYKCYSKEHFFWIGTVAIPILAVWVIGAPLIALIILYRHRKSLEEGFIKEYMLILYQGLKPKSFYWEFINTLRKGLILCCSVFLSTYSPIYQTLFSVGILIGIMRLQQFLKPYKYYINNDLELSAINAGVATLFSGIIFSQENTNYGIFNTLALTFLITTNAIFIIQWFFFLLLSLNLKNMKFRKLLDIYAFIIMRKKFLENYRTQESSSTTNKREATRKFKPKKKTRSSKKSIKSNKKFKLSLKRDKKLDIESKHEKYMKSKVEKFSLSEEGSTSPFQITKKNVKMKRALNDDKTLIFKITGDNPKNTKNENSILDVCDELEEYEEEKIRKPLDCIYDFSD